MLLAACGGAAAPTTTTTPRKVGSETEEDWRGFLAQIAGSPCRWIPGASFLACIQPGGDPSTTLIGWEANNRRYVAWRVAHDGAVSIMPGTAGNAGWQFEGPDGEITFARTAAGWDATGLAAAPVPVVADPHVKPPAATAVPASSENWRNALEGFTAVWTFSGTDHGTSATRQVHCMWIAAATFLSCKAADSDGFQLIGYEPHNARYVSYWFTPTAVDVLTATRDGRNWTFASPTQRITYGYESPLRRTFKREERAGGTWQIVTDGTLETKVE